MLLRDPLLALLPFIPFLASLALRFLTPLLAAFLRKALGFELMDYGEFIRLVLALFPGMFYGMAAGFLFLDDRDAGIASYWAITPVRRSGYLAARLGLFAALAYPAGIACAYIVGIGAPRFGPLAWLAFAGALQAPLLALALAAFADNKVEGLAMVKALGIVDVAPLAVLLPESARFVAWPFPQYWAALGYLTESAPVRLSAAALAVLSSWAWGALLLARYKKRIE